jgi:hypothetical protein
LLEETGSIISEPIKILEVTYEHDLGLELEAALLDRLLGETGSILMSNKTIKMTK